MRARWPLVLVLALAGCDAPVDDDDGGPAPTPPPDEPVGCDPLSLTEEQVCDDGRNAEGFAADQVFCPEFWASIDLDDGWDTLSSRWTMDFTAVQPAAVLDHWEYRNIQGEALTADLPVDVIVSIGTPCATAADPVACADALAALRPVDGFVSGCAPTGCTADSLAWSAGDSVGAVTDAASMAAFLGAVDSLPDALLLASASVPGFGWSTGDLMQGAAREVADGWEIVGSVPVWSAPYRSDALRLHVATDGTVTVEDRALAALDCGVEL